MTVSGRWIILASVTIAAAMAGGAWWYHFQASHRAAEFWGGPAARLLIGGQQVELLELGAAARGDEPQGAGRAIVATHDLSRQPGLIHLRHALTQDAHFEWAGRLRLPLNDADQSWAYALRFSEGGESLTILLRRDLAELAKLETPGDGAAAIDVLPCPRLAGPVRKYLADVGALPVEPTR